MRDILECMTVFCNAQQLQQKNQSMMQTSTTTEIKDSSGTQTEIVAVHTPQVENLPFPFANRLQRPSTLQLGDTSEAANRKIPDNDVSKHKIDEEERKETSNDNEKELISKSSRDETPENTEKDQCVSKEAEKTDEKTKDESSSSKN